MRIVRTLVLSGLVAAAPLAPLAAAHAAQGVNFSNPFTDYTTWTLYGSATADTFTPGNGFRYSNLTLTPPGSDSQAGAGFAPTPLALDFNQAFEFSFNFFIPTSAGLRGDGLTFVLADAPGVGGTGSGLGYEGLSPASVAFAIDTFNFVGEPESPSVQILQGGSVTPVAFVETGLGDSIRDPDFQWFAQVAYAPSGNGDDAGTLTGTISHINLGTFSVSAAIDFAALGLVGQDVRYGFTGSNGAATDGHIVTSAVPFASPVPEPASAWLLALSLIGMASRGGRRRARAPERPSV